MTLTTAKVKKKDRNGKERTVKDSFDVLRERIRRATLKKDGFWGFKFNRYFCLRTSEGNGVLHVVFWGRFIPQVWLSKAWEEIHGAFRADIRACTSRRGSVNGLVGYLLTNYLSQQPIERMSYGWKWAWLGFCKSWEKTKVMYGKMRNGHGLYLVSLVKYPGLRFLKTAWHNHSVEAWRCTLWKPPASSRQLRLKKKEQVLPKKVYGAPRMVYKWVHQAHLYEVINM